MAAGDVIDRRANPGRGEAGALLREPGLPGEAVTTAELRSLEPRYLSCAHGVATPSKPGVFCSSRHIRIFPNSAESSCAGCLAYENNQGGIV